MKITIDNIDYDLNVNSAIANGAMKKIKKMRPISIRDIPNGSIFGWKTGLKIIRYVMINNSANTTKQCIVLDEARLGVPACFNSADRNLTYYDSYNRIWISEVEDVDQRGIEDDEE